MPSITNERIMKSCISNTGSNQVIKKEINSNYNQNNQIDTKPFWQYLQASQVGDIEKSKRDNSYKEKRTQEINEIDSF